VGKGEGGFVKHDMTRDDDTISGEIKTPIAFVIAREAKEGAQSGPWGEFV
jgi:hypothetical protein